MSTVFFHDLSEFRLPNGLPLILFCAKQRCEKIQEAGDIVNAFFHIAFLFLSKYLSLLFVSFFVSVFLFLFNATCNKVLILSQTAPFPLSSHCSAMNSVNDALRSIPSVQECIQAILHHENLRDIPLQRIKHCVQLYIHATRQELLYGKRDISAITDRQAWLEQLAAFTLQYHHPRFRRVINATGVIIHTNLGRSLLPEKARQQLLSGASHYTNLEFDLHTGKRGSRYAHVEELLCELTGAEAALVVNNNAAAVLISLETLAKNKEVVVSRGQLVEIGGSFRIPDIMARSGASLVEVGCTNRTHLRDYTNAITENTGLLLRVHCSNYTIIGFTSEVSATDLVQLSRQHRIPVMEDLGSGCLVDLQAFGLTGEPRVQDVVASGVDVLTFSGDKLLGGPQAGIIVGKKKYIEEIKKNPLNRALRIDKFTLAALEAVLRLYLDPVVARKEIPTLAMLGLPEEGLRQRAEQLAKNIQKIPEADCQPEILPVFSQVGGGALPEQKIPSWAVALCPETMPVNQLEQGLRQAPIPVVARIADNRLLVDLRTVAEDELELLTESLRFVFLSAKR